MGKMQETILIDGFDYPILDLGDREIMLLISVFKTWSGQHYAYGAKSEGIDSNSRANNPKHIDCSGFFGMALDYITGDTRMPGRTPTHLHQLGSRQQYDVLGNAGLKETTDLPEVDNILRSFHLLSEDSGSGIGHIGFVRNGYTIESCGSLGVCRRKFDVNQHEFMKHVKGFVLAVPDDYQSKPLDL